MQAFLIVSCFSLFVAVQSLAIEQRSCATPDVIAIAQQVSHPHYFCNWYLSDGRTNSPIPGINADALLSACRCVVSVEPAGTKTKTLDAIAKAARLYSYVSATCPSTPGNPISEEFKNPSSFCTFFKAYERHDSPIPNLNVPAVRHACKCVLDSPKSSSKISSTRKTSSSSVERTASKPSLSSTKKSISKTPSTVTSKSSSKKISTRISSGKLSSLSQTSKPRTSTRSSSTKTLSSKISSMKVSSNTSSSKKSSSAGPSSSKISSTKTSTSKIVTSTRLSSSQMSSGKVTWSTTSSIGGTASSISSSKASSKSPAFTLSVSSSVTSNSVATSKSSGSLTPSRSPISSSSLSSSSVPRPTPIANSYAPCGNQPDGSIFANRTGQYELYCNNYDIDGMELYDSWTGMWSSMQQCDANAACTGVKCKGTYCMLYRGPLTLVPASTWSVAMRIMPDAYEQIISNDLEAFCTTYLGYTTPAITETKTLFANATRTAVFNLTVTSTIATLTTKTDFVETVTVNSTISASASPTPIKKRALETPIELGSYSENEISSGCSRAATQLRTTTISETVAVTSTESVATTTTTTAYKNITSIITELATYTTTILINATSSTIISATCTPTPKVDAEQQAKDLTALDFLFSHNNLTSMLSTFPVYILNQTSITGDVLPPIQTALQNWVPCTATSHNVTDQLLACADTTNPITFAACIIFRTDPDSIRVWRNNPNVPVSALTKVRNDYRSTNVGIDGVPITLNMSLIEVIDHSTEGGHYQARDFKNMQYYFGEYNRLF